MCILYVSFICYIQISVAAENADNTANRRGEFYDDSSIGMQYDDITTVLGKMSWLTDAAPPSLKAVYNYFDLIDGRVIKSSTLVKTG